MDMAILKFQSGMSRKPLAHGIRNVKEASNWQNVPLLIGGGRHSNHTRNQKNEQPLTMTIRRIIYLLDSVIVLAIVGCCASRGTVGEKERQGRGSYPIDEPMPRTRD